MKRRYKLLIGFIITGVILIIIFLITQDKKIYYLSLGDSLALGYTPYNTKEISYGDYVSAYLKKRGKLQTYTNKYAKSEYRSIDVLNDINNNKEIVINGQKTSLKHALIKADLVTLSIGTNDLFYKLNIGNSFNIKNYEDLYKYVDETILDIDKLLYTLRKSCKEQIMVFGFYNPFINYSDKLSNIAEPIIYYANSKMKHIVDKYDMTYIDIHSIFLNNKSYLPNKYDIHPTNEGYKAISDSIIKLIDNKMLAK